MDDAQLENMDLAQLKDLQRRISKAIETFEDRRKMEAVEKLERQARELGFSLADLASAAGPKKRRPATAKYANPANPSETWSGRGRKPRWVLAAEAEGRPMDDLAI